MKTKIIFHDADLDGHTSAAILLLQHSTHNEEVDLVPYDYDRDLNSRLITGNVIYMVDVSVKANKILELAKDSAEFYLIDHHVSFYDDLIKYCVENAIHMHIEQMGLSVRITIKEFNFTYYYTSKISACELTARLFGSNIGAQSKRLIQILGQYDTWRDTSDKKFIDDEDWQSIVLPVQYSLRAYMNPEKLAKILYSLDNKGERYSISKLVTQGEVIINYLKSKNQDDLERYSFSFDMHGMKFLAMNTNNFNSFAFDHFYNPDFHDAMMAFNFTGKEWRISLYTTKDSVDILKIAKFFGGGGHSKACGFKIPHNQMVFRSGKLELGILTIMDLALLPETYKGIDVKVILEQLKSAGHNLVVSEESKPQIKLIATEKDIQEVLPLVEEEDPLIDVKTEEKPKAVAKRLSSRSKKK